MKKKLKVIVVLLIVTSTNIKAQITETRFGIETTFDGKTPVAYEGNYGAIKLNTNTSELVFQTNLADIKTRNKKVDSLLNEVETIAFIFKGNVGIDVFKLITEQNDDTYHKILGSVIVDNIVYQAEGYIKLENFGDKSNLNKLYIDFKIQIDPKLIQIPYLSAYFNNQLLIEINDGLINQTF